MKPRLKRQRHYAPFRRQNRRPESDELVNFRKEVIEESDIIQRLNTLLKRAMESRESGRNYHPTFYPTRERLYGRHLEPAGWTEGEYNAPVKMTDYARQITQHRLNQLGIGYRYRKNKLGEDIGFELDIDSFVQKCIS